MENEHYIVPPLSKLWWLGLLFSATFIFLTLVLGVKLPPGSKKKLGMALGGLFLFLAFAIHIYEWYEGLWNLRKSLPLQLCAVSGILSGLVFFWKNQRAFELLVFWRIPGAFHSIVTPEMSHGKTDFLVVEYYISHAGIILSALYLPLVMGRSLRRRSWINSFVFTVVILFVVGIINYFLDANYMYLCQKPMADNPMIVGGWPWYVFVLLGVGLTHFFVVYWVYKMAGWVTSTNSSRTIAGVP